MVLFFVILSVFALLQLAGAAEPHGEGSEGTVMGPVAFLWPSDRPWAADADNIGPCGSNAAITNRTKFPLVRGAVALSIADEAWDVALRIAYGNKPTTQSAFQSIKGNVSEIDPGHQCYGIPDTPRTTSEGSNATIQLEYWSSDSAKNESFFACADITFVRNEFFTEQIPCFNVTSEDFGVPTVTTTTAAQATSATQSVIATESNTNFPGSQSGSGLSAGAKAGISVGAIVGFSLVAGAVIIFIVRKRRASKGDTETIKLSALERIPSFNSSQSASRI